ncbi:MAG: SRPBCC family protein [Myxococcota bacterium]|nr:SRPBCC family protein [Myxococcota bacterium]
MKHPFICLLAVTSFVALPSEGRAEEHKPHPHPPILKPIVSTPDPVKLTADEKAQLNKGEPVLRQSKDDSGGAGIAIQTIDAPPSVVWKTILAYDKYKDWVDNVKSCKVYKKSGILWYVEMTSKFMWVSSTLYTINRIRKKMNYMSWTLDRNRTSDVRDMIGYWLVLESPDNPNKTRLEYSTELVLGGVPDFIVNILTKDALVDGTAWVKKRSEEAFASKNKAQK